MISEPAHSEDAKLLRREESHSRRGSNPLAIALRRTDCWSTCAKKRSRNAPASVNNRFQTRLDGLGESTFFAEELPECFVCCRDYLDIPFTQPALENALVRLMKEKSYRFFCSFGVRVRTL